MRKILALTEILGLVAFAGLAWAMPNLVPATNTHSGRTLIIPDTAVQVADNVFDLGTAVDTHTGLPVRGYAILHYRTGFHHSPTHSGGPPAGGGGGSNCFSFLANGAKWKTVEPWIVNTSNGEGLLSSFVFDNLTADVLKWEDAADGTVGSGAGVNILGDGSVTAATLVADTSSPDNQNEVYFGDVGSQGAIAVTIVWGIFSGPPSQRQLVEWDMIFDEVDYNWSSTGAAGLMDFENIATHELGHSTGMADLYTFSCSEETMYGYADFGETKKRDLNAGDIAGVSSLY